MAIRLVTFLNAEIFVNLFKVHVNFLSRFEVFYNFVNRNYYSCLPLLNYEFIRWQSSKMCLFIIMH